MARRKRSSWDWADALEKMLRGTLYSQGREYPEQTTAAIFRRLAARQRNCCALSGTHLLYPTVAELPTHTCLNKWRDNLARVRPTDSDCSPDLVKANAYLDWIPGNIILIAHRYYQLYNSTDGIAGFKACCANAADYRVTVPQAEALLPTAADIAKANERMHKYEIVVARGCGSCAWWAWDCNNIDGTCTRTSKAACTSPEYTCYERSSKYE